LFLVEGRLYSRPPELLIKILLISLAKVIADLILTNKSNSIRNRNIGIKDYKKTSVWILQNNNLKISGIFRKIQKQNYKISYGIIEFILA
jgi:hypothetical protein